MKLFKTACYFLVILAIIIVAICATYFTTQAEDLGNGELGETLGLVFIIMFSVIGLILFAIVFVVITITANVCLKSNDARKNCKRFTFLLVFLGICLPLLIFWTAFAWAYLLTNVICMYCVFAFFAVYVVTYVLLIAGKKSLKREMITNANPIVNDKMPF